MRLRAVAALVAVLCSANTCTPERENGASQTERVDGVVLVDTGDLDVRPEHFGRFVPSLESDAAFRCTVAGRFGNHAPSRDRAAEPDRAV